MIGNPIVFSDKEAYYAHYNELNLRISGGLYESNGVRISRETEALRSPPPWDTRREMSNETVRWSSYTLYPMPGCCGIVVYSGASVYFVQGLGFGNYFHQEALDLMQKTGYSCGFCTVTSTMWQQKKILTKNGWKKIHEFRNQRSGNLVEMWVKDLIENQTTSLTVAA